MTTIIKKVIHQISVRLEFTNANAYARMQGFVFPGEDVVGTPTDIRIPTKVDNASAPGDLRIRDITNSLTICTVTGVVGTSYAIISMGTLSNLPVGEAFWEVQGQVTAGGSDAVYADVVCIEY